MKFLLTFLVLFFNVEQRITIPQILEDPWFKKGYKPPVFYEKCQTSLDDVNAAFGDSEVSQMNLFVIKPISLLYLEVIKPISLPGPARERGN